MLGNRGIESVLLRHIGVRVLALPPPGVVFQQQAQAPAKIVVLYPVAEAGSKTVRIDSAEDGAFEGSRLEKGTGQAFPRRAVHQNPALSQNLLKPSGGELIDEALQLQI